MSKSSVQWSRIVLPIGLIVVVSALVFLPFAGRLGFYRDDWYMLWSANTRGPDSIIELFSIDRPFMGYTYDLTFRILGNTPFTWQLYAFALKTLGAVGIYGIMRLIWPEQRRAAAAAALLYLVYPGFIQQPNAATKTNQLLSLTSALLSIWFSGLALRAGRRAFRAVFVSAALLLGLLNFLLYEYMIGLEVLRLWVFWLAPQIEVPLDFRGRVRRLALHWWPYLSVILGFLIWRLGFFTSTRSGTDQFSVVESVFGSPRSTLVFLGLESFMDTLETVVFAWAVPFERYAAVEKNRQLGLTLFSGVALTALVLIVFWFQQKLDAEDDQAGRGRAIWIVLAGAVSLYGAFFPVLAAGRDVYFTAGFDKYTLHASPAAAILIVGFLFGWLNGRGKQVMLAVLLFLGISTHLLNMYHWERFWNDEKDLWWQLWWRAPGLQDGTILLTSFPRTGIFEDYEAWGPANLIYRPDIEVVTIGAEVLNPGTILKVRAGAVETRAMRGLAYQRDYNRSLLLALPDDNSCLKVVDRDDIVLPMQVESRLVPILRFSYVDQIDPAAPRVPPPEAIFGSEPDHDWCYYYQSAELAKQGGDWETVVQLGEAVIDAELTPIDRVEWLPFLEVFIWAEDANRIDDIAIRIADDAPRAKEICDALGTRQFRFGETIQQGLVEALCDR